MSAVQHFASLRAACRESGCLFVDAEFRQDVSDAGVEWRRPKEFCSKPKFLDCGASTLDICQGELGDCWLLSSMASLARDASLFSRVVPEDQSFGDGYCGIFHFMIWRFGDWLDVVIDDQLPTKNGRLIYSKSESREEMWSALLEKAYAKVCGGYSALQGGTIPEAMEDFTGGMAEAVTLSRHASEDIWEMIVQSESSSFPMACYIEVTDPGDIGHVNEDGLVLGHAYSVLGAKEVQHDCGDVALIRLRNPWGFTEYNGPWSDRSPEWQSVSGKEQKELNLQKEDGEFWMLCEDFCSFFTHMVVCHVGLEAGGGQVTYLRGRWQIGLSAGGGRRLRTFCNNPQFRLRVGGSLEQGAEHDPAEEERWTVLVELMQTDAGAEKLHISCHLYKVPPDMVSRPRLDRIFFARNRAVCDSGEPLNSRGVTLRASLPPGDYVILPSTYDANQEGGFYIRASCRRAARKM